MHLDRRFRLLLLWRANTTMKWPKNSCLRAYSKLIQNSIKNAWIPWGTNPPLKGNKRREQKMTDAKTWTGETAPAKIKFVFVPDKSARSSRRIV